MEPGTSWAARQLSILGQSLDWPDPDGMCGVPGRARLTGPDVKLMGEISPLLFISLLLPNYSDQICVPGML